MPTTPPPGSIIRTINFCLSSGPYCFRVVNDNGKPVLKFDRSTAWLFEAFPLLLEVMDASDLDVFISVLLEARQAMTTFENQKVLDANGDLFPEEKKAAEWLEQSGLTMHKEAQ